MKQLVHYNMIQPVIVYNQTKLNFNLKHSKRSRTTWQRSGNDRECYQDMVFNSIMHYILYCVPFGTVMRRAGSVNRYAWIDWLIDWLIDWIEFYAVSATFQPYSGGFLPGYMYFWIKRERGWPFSGWFHNLRPGCRSYGDTAGTSLWTLCKCELYSGVSMSLVWRLFQPI